MLPRNNKLVHRDINQNNNIIHNIYKAGKQRRRTKIIYQTEVEGRGFSSEDRYWIHAVVEVAVMEQSI